ncbi:MAG: hypothetical protein F6J98_35510 [Moorea sp. SIO4G2]|nr:hypothetical protein [Moorena sp. SIO4G2]
MLKTSDARYEPLRDRKHINLTAALFTLLSAECSENPQKGFVYYDW